MKNKLLVLRAMLRPMLLSKLLPVLLLLFLSAPLHSAEKYNYALKPQQIAKDTYVFMGLNEGFSLTNGGNIANSAFIVTDDGVIVIDTGPSRLYGEQMRTAIKTITNKPVRIVINTHHHPDHFFGNQVFVNTDLVALASTQKAMQANAEDFSNNMYRMCGVWMQGTSPIAANRSISAGPLQLGQHRLRIINMAGHSEGDMVILDETTGVLFTGDLVFNDRAPTTPHAYIAGWLNSLRLLEKLDYRLMVPGHGAVVSDNSAIRLTADYLKWLDTVMSRGAAQGQDMAEMLYEPIPPQFQKLAQIKEEYERSVSHLYRKYEQDLLVRIDTGEN